MSLWCVRRGILTLPPALQRESWCPAAKFLRAFKNVTLWVAVLLSHMGGKPGLGKSQEWQEHAAMHEQKELGSTDFASLGSKA